ncbi:hypothetical protein [Methylocystis iwaonis]|uniref:O-antigen ligase domain-containing protein n=1 Tax=Methylocystis iwaonis TaxID=2885079 RepID=A0ABN6VJY7_9HYPH|nr:hypothetical protein [Methylocystis iwaonis]BDV36036.1 hypothetical protein SS37A_35660 [Methylocystis iwaonis]
MLNFALALVLAGNLILGFSFMQIRLPGLGIPLGETVLILGLLGSNVVSSLLEMRSVIRLFPLVAWWCYAIGWAVFFTPEYGLWALRDASQAIDSLYLIVGYSFASQQQALERLFRWLPAALVVAVAYASVGYIFRTEIIAASPQIVSEHGEAVPIFGLFNTGDVVIFWAAACLIIRFPGAPWAALLAGALASYIIVVFQNRTAYMQLAALVLLMWFLRRSAIRPLLSFAPLLVAALAAIEVLELHVPGRLTSQVSLSFFVDHIAAMVGISDGSNDAISAAASGVDQRMQWWTDLIERVTADSTTFLTGLGFGFPLISFGNVAGIQVREPHNSMMSVFSRCGLIGFAVWFWMHAELFYAALKAFFRAGAYLPSRLWQDRIFVMLAFVVLVLMGSLGEDNLEKPYFAIPYYFLWGVILRGAFTLGSFRKNCGSNCITSPANVGVSPSGGSLSSATGG